MFTVTGIFTFGVFSIGIVGLMLIWFINIIDWSDGKDRTLGTIGLIATLAVVGWLMPVWKMKSPQLIPGKNVEVVTIDKKAALVRYDRERYKVVEHPYLVANIRDTSKVDIHFYKIRPLLGEHPLSSSPNIRVKPKTKK